MRDEMHQSRRLRLIACLIVVVTITTGSAGFAQTAAVSGKDEYINSCGACHGRSGKGKGPVALFLNRAPTDLTALAKTNHGVFPEQSVERYIDGTHMIGPHGTGEMPIWGNKFGPDAKVRIQAIVDYLKSIQEK